MRLKFHLKSQNVNKSLILVTSLQRVIVTCVLVYQQFTQESEST